MVNGRSLERIGKGRLMAGLFFWKAADNSLIMCSKETVVGEANLACIDDKKRSV